MPVYGPGRCLDRFLDLVFIMFMSASVLYLSMGVQYYFGNVRARGKAVHPAFDERFDTLIATPAITPIHPLVWTPGGRPNVSAVFDAIHYRHPKNVALLTCGTRKMVDAVGEECQEYIRDGWIMSEGEWEW